MTDPQAALPDGDPPGRRSEDRVTVRRAPRYPRFIILGAGLGAVVTFISTALFPVDPEVGFAALLGYFMLFGIPAGAALGGTFAIVLDAIATRRSKQLTAERTTVDAPIDSAEPDVPAEPAENRTPDTR